MSNWMVYAIYKNTASGKKILMANGLGYELAVLLTDMLNEKNNDCWFSMECE